MSESQIVLQDVEARLKRALRGLEHAGDPRYVHETEWAVEDVQQALFGVQQAMEELAREPQLTGAPA